MWNIKREQEFLELECLLEDYIFITKRFKRKSNIRIIKYVKENLNILLSNKPLFLLSITNIFLLLIIFVIEKVNINMQFYFQIFQVIIIVIYLSSFLGLTTVLLAEVIKILFNKKSVKRKKIINKGEIKRSNIFIQEINDKFSKESVARFEERLKAKIKELNENVKKIDHYIPLLVLFLVFAINYIIGINTNIFFKNFNSFTGGLSIFAGISIIIKLVAVNSSEGVTKYYEEFLLILKEAQIERKCD